MRNTSKIRDYLQLVRLPNIFTAIADIIAGYLLVSHNHVHYIELAGLIVATAAIYGGGCVYNDYCDLKIDAVERPFRPIPSGRVTPREAAFLAIVLFLIGLVAAALAGVQSFLAAVSLVILVYIYDRFSKNIFFWGSLNMAACRALNLLLGMSSINIVQMNFLFPAVSLFYVFFLTTLSKFEVNGRPQGFAWIAFPGIISVIGFIIFFVTKGILSKVALWYIGAMSLCILPFLFQAFLHPRPETLGRAVKIMIISIPILDAVYVSGTHGFFSGIPVALCIIPAIVISRYLYVT